jgi:hypothetical protein
VLENSSDYTIRLISPPARIRRKVERHFTSSLRPTSDKPDISIRFQDSLPPAGRLRFIGLNKAAFDEEYFYLLDASGNRIRIDLREIGGHCEIVCEESVTALDFLLPLVRLRLLKKRYVLLHSSAFVYRGKGVLVTGWQKGGKTETLLAFMAAGAEYVSDEWTIVSESGRQLLGVPGILKVWDWHLSQLPEYRRNLPQSDRRRLRVSRGVKWLYRVTPHRRGSRGPVANAIHQLGLEGGNSHFGQARVAPERLFGGPLWDTPAPFDVLFLAIVDAGNAKISRSDPQEVAMRMVASQTYERQHLSSAYDHFRFAFPNRRSEFFEGAAEHELRLLSRAFSDKPAYEVAHPYPVSLHELYKVASPYV